MRESFFVFVCKESWWDVRALLVDNNNDETLLAIDNSRSRCSISCRCSNRCFRIPDAPSDDELHAAHTQMHVTVIQEARTFFAPFAQL